MYKRTQVHMLVVGALASVLVVAGVSGCGSSGTTTNASTGKLEVFNYWTSGAEKAALNSLIKNYQAQYPKVTVKNTAVAGGGGANEEAVLDTRIAGGDPPDVWQTHPGDILETYTKNNLIQNLTPIFNQQGWSKVMPKEVVASMKANGKVYTAITGVHQQNVLWYNKHVAAKLGIQISANLSFSDFMSDMAKAKAAGVTAMCNGDQQIFASAETVENTILAFVGPTTMKQLYVGKGWGSSQVAQAMRAYEQILDDENSNHTALTWDQALQEFGDGKCLFDNMSTGGYGQLLNDGFKDGVNFGYVLYPGTSSVFVDITDSFVVSAKAPDKVNADNWIKLIEQPKAQLAFSKLKGSIPVLTDVNVASLHPFQRESASWYRSLPILNTMTFGQSVTPSQETAFYNAVTSFDQSRNVTAFQKSMEAAF